MRVRQKPSGKWEVTVEGPPNADGKRQQVARSTWSDGRPLTSRTAAVKRGQELLSELADNFGQAASGKSVAAWLSEWLGDAESRLRPRTVSRYRYAMRYVPEWFSKLKLRDVTPMSCQALVAHWSKQPKLAPASQGLCFDTLRSAFNTAERLSLIPASPWRRATRPRVPRRRPTVWSSEQLRRFLDHCEQSPDRAAKFFVVQAHTGARIGELTHVEEQDYDPVAQELTIWRSKTKAGEGRVIPLTPEAIAAIDWWLAKKAEDEKFWKLPARRAKWLFRGQAGRKWNENYLDKWFRDVRQTLGLPYARPHDLRHHTASRMLKAGVDVKIVSTLLGHSNSSVTREIYQHVLDTDQLRQALDAAAADLRVTA